MRGGILGAVASSSSMLEATVLINVTGMPHTDHVMDTNEDA